MGRAVVSAFLALLAIAPGGAGAAPARGGIVRMSIAPGGVDAANNSSAPVVSADGRWVAFQSIAANLVSADRNRNMDVFVRAIAGGAVERVSVGAHGEADGQSFGASISGDGRYVAFTSTATNLLRARKHGPPQVYVRDRLRRTTTLVSAVRGTRGSERSYGVHISADGRFVTYLSESPELIGRGGRRAGVLLHDRATGSTRVVAFSPDREPHPNRAIIGPYDVSSDGRFVTFGHSGRLTIDDRNDAEDVYLYDATTRRVTLASKPDTAGQSDGASHNGAVSDDGRFVVFHSVASNMTDSPFFAGAARPIVNVFLRDMRARRTRLISATPAGTYADGDSFTPDVSADGGVVVFASQARTLDPAPEKGCGGPIEPPTVCTSIFAHSLIDRTTTTVSLSPGGKGANASSYLPRVSRDGGTIAFSSFADNMVAGDRNVSSDIYAYVAGAGFRCASGKRLDGPVSGWLFDVSWLYAAGQSGALRDAACATLGEAGL